MKYVESLRAKCSRLKEQLSSFGISADYYQMDCGTEINYKSSIASCTFFVFIFHSNSCRLWHFFLVCCHCVMYKNCWLNLLVETARQFMTFVSSLKVKNGSIVISQERNALERKSVPYKSPIWAQPVASGPFAAHLAGPPSLIWLHKWTLYSSREKSKDLDVNCIPRWCLARDKCTNQWKAKCLAFCLNTVLIWWANGQMAIKHMNLCHEA